MNQSHESRNVTQDDVAQLAGVSRSIVSYVINNGPRKVSEDTRQRVLDAISELGYRPNKHAQRLSSTSDSISTKYIGIILAHDYMFRRPYYGSILASIHDHAHHNELHIRFIRVFEDFKNPALFNELIHPDEIGGAILLGLDQAIDTPNDQAMIAKIVARVDKVVCVEWEWPGVSSVQFDRRNAAYQAACHLFDIGRKQVAYIGPDDQRVQGYQQALWQNNVSLQRELQHFGLNAEGGYECCQALLQTGVPFDAICAGTDEAAIGILKCLYHAGRRVPEDVAVAGIDNLDISAYTIPSLTTVDIPKDEIGLHTISALLNGHSHKQHADVSITVRTHLVQRNSTTIR